MPGIAADQHRDALMRDDHAFQALIAESYGDWRDVRVGSMPHRPPGPDDVLIEAHAASINFPDLLMIAGKYQHRPAPPFIPGRDVAGRIVAVGDNVRSFAVGDRVAAQPPHGAFAEEVVAPARFSVRIPDNVSYEDAAASGTILATVAAALGLRARLQRGEWLLLTGAAGGVGSAAIQYARARGARVAALVSSQEKELAARSLGAEVVLRSDKMASLKGDLRDHLAHHGLDGVDAAMDVVGGDEFEAVIRCIRPEGRVIVVGFASGRIPQIPANYLLLKDIAVIGSSLDRLFRSEHPAFRALLTEAFDMLANGRIKAPIEARYPLAEFARAAARIASRQAIGKLVLLPRLRKDGCKS